MTKKVYFSMTTHPNMNYDRSLRSVIWEQFPKLYRLYLAYLRDHPQLKSHVQLPPQTLLSLKQCAPDVIEWVQALRAEGRVKIMGTYMSESIAQSQDGMSLLDAAELGCGIASEELDADLEGFFLQEIAYSPQLPYVINKLGVQWTIIFDWDGALRPFWAEGLDGSRCIAVPLIERAQQKQIYEHPELIPDNTLIITHCDMEIPNAIKHMHELETHLRDDYGYDTEWCFVSEYIEKVGVNTVKRPTPCTNKPQGTTASPSFSRWNSDPLSMQVHAATLRTMEARRSACLAAFGKEVNAAATNAVPTTRPDTTWEVENPWIYPELVQRFGPNVPGASPFQRMAMLIAWGCNSDARGWYPMLERRFERVDSFHEATLVADTLIRELGVESDTPTRGPGLVAVNAHGVNTPTWHVVRSVEPVALLDNEGHDAVQLVRRNGDAWEHHVRLQIPAYGLRTWRKVPTHRIAENTQPGDTITAGGLTANFDDGTLTISRQGSKPMTLALDPFRIYVKNLDGALRDPQPEGDWHVSVIPGEYPRLVAERQIDYHIHFRAEYTLDDGRLWADWRFWFTYPTLVDSLDDFDAGGPVTDFEPGGLCATLSTGVPGDIWYDVPFGVVQHPNAEASFIPPLTHAYINTAQGGTALVSQSGSQSFKVHGSAGRLGLCMGKSTTSGGRRKLQHWSGDTIDEFGCDTEWYKEFFYGEHHHRFVVNPFDGDWREQALPNVCRALAQRPRVVESLALAARDRSLAEITPANVRLVGLEPDTGRIVLCEMTGRETDYHLRIGEVEREGRIGPFGIVELCLG